MDSEIVWGGWGAFLAVQTVTSALTDPNPMVAVLAAHNRCVVTLTAPTRWRWTGLVLLTITGSLAFEDLFEDILIAPIPWLVLAFVLWRGMLDVSDASQPEPSISRPYPAGRDDCGWCGVPPVGRCSPVELIVLVRSGHGRRPGGLPPLWP